MKLFKSIDYRLKNNKPRWFIISSTNVIAYERRITFYNELIIISLKSWAKFTIVLRKTNENQE